MTATAEPTGRTRRPRFSRPSVATVERPTDDAAAVIPVPCPSGVRELSGAVIVEAVA